MKYLLLILILSFSTLMNAQARLEEELETKESAYKEASSAREQGQLALEIARLHGRLRNDRNEKDWLRRSISLSRQANDNALYLEALRELNSNYRGDEYRLLKNDNLQAIDYLQDNLNTRPTIIREGADPEALERKQMENQLLRSQKAQLEQQNQHLQATLEEVRKAMLEVESVSQGGEQVIQQSQNETNQTSRGPSPEELAARRKLDSLLQKNQKVEQLTAEQQREIERLREESESAKASLNRVREQWNTFAARYDLMVIGLVAAGLLVVTFLGFIALALNSAQYRKRKAKELAKANEEIKTEKTRADKLLLNILPQHIADELKAKNQASAKRYEEVNVLFSDFEGFSQVAERMSPEQLVEQLDLCFKAFDKIIGKYPDIEKIKTIGDAYMCASGLSGRRSLPNNLVRAALEMQEYLRDYQEDRLTKGLPFFEARIGIHTGPVVAGVVGEKKFAYDIWGDTVNIAARLEAEGTVGRVNISNDTFQQIKYKFECTYRGKINAKNKGQIDMYFVEKEREVTPA